MAKTLCKELNLVLTIEGVHKDFVGLGAKGNKSSRWTNLNTQNFVWVVNLSYWSAFITVPEVDGCSLSATDQFKLVVASLRHAKKGTVHCLVAVHSFFLFQVISGDRTIS